MDKALLKYSGIGAGATIVAGFIPFVSVLAPVIGGGVAGWLGINTKHSGTTLGAAAGAMASLLFIPLVLLGAILAVFDFGIGLLVFLSVAIIGTAVLTGFGALGGAIGAALADNSTSTEQARVDSAAVDDSRQFDRGDRDRVTEIQQRYASGELTESELETELENTLTDETERPDRIDTRLRCRR